VQVRAHGGVAPAEVRIEPDRLLVRLSEPLRGVARGQAVVLYDGDRVVGSATIDEAVRTPSAVR
jgi:tRNA-specific 2-thiouridylase